MPLKPADSKIAVSDALPAVVLLNAVAVAKPWGRLSGQGWSSGVAFDERVGELHHRLPGDDALPVMIAGADALLVKTLFTDAMLSVQVHPDAASAHALGMPRGKDEAWLVLEAEPEAQIGLGLRAAMSAEALANAVADGSIMDEMIWQQVVPGQVLFAPAGTIHAIGAGVTVLEVQENNDLTWRLYDHGRGRQLDLEPGLKVARREAFAGPAVHASPGEGRAVLVAGGGFVLERVIGNGRLCPVPGRPVWAAAVSDGVRLGDVPLARGAVALVTSAVAAAAADGLMLAQSGPEPQAGLWEPM